MQTVDAAKYGPWALVLGASEGIGVEIAERLAGSGIHLALAARKREPLAALAADLATRHGIETRVLVADLAGASGPDDIIVGTADLDIGLLAFVAGAGIKSGPTFDLTREQMLMPIALNPVAQTVLATHFGGKMRERGRGGILIVSSDSASAGMAGLTIYSASKAYTNAFCEGLWYELKPHGVDVVALVIGTTRTPSLGRQGAPIDNPAFPGAWPADIAEEALAHLGDGPVYCAAGTGPGFYRRRALPREEAAREAGDMYAAIVGARPLPR